MALSTNNMDPKVEIKETVPDDKGKYIVEGFISQDVTLNCQVNDLPPGLDVSFNKTFEFMIYAQYVLNFLCTVLIEPMMIIL